METIFIFIFEAIAEFTLTIFLKFPGAFIRWAFTGFKRKFIDVVNDDGFINGAIGLVVVIIMVVVGIMLTNS